MTMRVFYLFIDPPDVDNDLLNVFAFDSNSSTFRVPRAESGVRVASLLLARLQMRVCPDPFHNPFSNLFYPVNIFTAIFTCECPIWDF